MWTGLQSVVDKFSEHVTYWLCQDCLYGEDQIDLVELLFGQYSQGVRYQGGGVSKDSRPSFVVEN